MIKIFRNIRRNLLTEGKTMKYFKYAFGEIILVVIGILIALQINNWNEINKSNAETSNYIDSFYEENKSNKESIILAIAYNEEKIKSVDSLKQFLLSKNYTHKRINILCATLMGMSNYDPSTTTMENISASGDFDLIKDIDLRKLIINTYKAYKTTTKLETILNDYLNKYVSPFFIENVRFNDFSSLKKDFIKDPKFENIVLGYEVLLNQQINGYKENLDKISLLDDKLIKYTKEND